MIQGLLEARELANMLAEATELLLDCPRACQLRKQYEEFVLQNDVSTVDTGGENCGRIIYSSFCGGK